MSGSNSLVMWPCSAAWKVLTRSLKPETYSSYDPSLSVLARDSRAPGHMSHRPVDLRLQLADFKKQA